MANVYAVKTGSWTDNTVWNTGAQPTSADDVYSNNFAVTINTSPTVLSIRNTAAAGIAAGGVYTASAGITINANLIQGSVTLLLFSGGTVTINGNITGGSGQVTLNNSSTALIIVGNITAGTTACVAHNTSSSLTVTGTVTGGTGSNAYGIQYPQSTCTVTGSVYGGSTSTAYGIGGVSGTLTVNGNVYGGSAAYGIYHQYSATCVVNGSAFAGTGQAAVFNNTTGIVRVTNAVGNGWGLGSVGSANVPAVVSNVNGSLTYIKQLTFGSLGNTPVSGPIILTADTTNTVQFYKEGGGTKTLVDPTATSGVLPSAADVRTGVVYSSGNLTGTCAVPAAGSVALGVPVDATTGTAVLTAAGARTALGMASANLDAQLAAIPTTAAPTVTAIRTEMDTNSTKLANLDATVSSRSTYAGGDTSGTTTLLSRLTSTRAGYLDNIATAAPSAVDIATAVWAAATRTLTTAIDNSATIAAAVWSYATGRTITGGTVDTLTNAPTVPSAAAIASQVRTELTPELARMANAATVDTTGQQIQDAVTN